MADAVANPATRTAWQTFIHWISAPVRWFQESRKGWREGAGRDPVTGAKMPNAGDAAKDIADTAGKGHGAANVAAPETAEKGTGFIAGLTQKGGAFGNVAKHGGWVKAMGEGVNEIIGKTPATTGVRFMRVGGVGVGAAFAADALFRSKKSDGEDRGAAGRLIQFVAGGGIAAASLAAGKGI